MVDFPRTQAISLDVISTADLESHIASHNLVISLVPFIYHAAVIKAAIKSKTNVVTTSYVSPAMIELEAAAKEAGIVVLNEVGVDPGIDHLYAIKKIDDVHSKGGKVRSALKNPHQPASCTHNPRRLRNSTHTAEEYPPVS